MKYIFKTRKGITLKIIILSVYLLMSNKGYGQSFNWSVGPSASYDILLFKKNTGHPIENNSAFSYSVGVLGSATYKSKVIFNLGIGYTQLNYQMRFNFKNTLGPDDFYLGPSEYSVNQEFINASADIGLVLLSDEDTKFYIMLGAKPNIKVGSSSEIGSDYSVNNFLFSMTSMIGISQKIKDKYLIKFGPGFSYFLTEWDAGKVSMLNYNIVLQRITSNK